MKQRWVVSAWKASPPSALTRWDLGARNVDDLHKRNASGTQNIEMGG